ncbi:MAG: RNA 2',3'-cyclic phosphodiesterase [Bacteroidetes bacterium QH_2_63_10]|nr:MAG: RNA 2',3'-cyclic phosphodiesterase [Bacteroidetes bacterium QH_2_63_10]
MRLFTAIDPPDDVRDHLSTLQMPATLDARWTDPTQFHVTIRFIGDASPDQAVRYEEALFDADMPVVNCRPYGLDVLPSRRNPRVLAVGLERSDTLMTLYRAVSTALESKGVSPEDRSYRPHVTLARLTDTPAEAVHAFLDRHDIDSIDSFRVDTLSLYESTLTQEGAVHERRAAIPLGT